MISHIRYFFVLPLSLFLVSCDSKEMESLLERQDYYKRNIETYAERVEKAKRKLDELKEEVVEASENAAPSIASIKSRETTLAEMRESINQLAGIEAVMKEKASLLEAYRNAFIVKTLPVGTNLGDITLTNGTQMKGVVVRENLDGGVKLAHSGGFSDLNYALLPEPIRNNYSIRPLKDYLDIDIFSVIGRKPSFIMSDEEHRSNVERKIVALESQRSEDAARREAERRERMEKEREARLKAEAEEELKSRRLADYRAKANAYDAQLSQLYNGLDVQEARKSEVLENASRGSIRIAASDLQKLVAPYDQKILELRAQIAKLQREKASLPPP